MAFSNLTTQIDRIVIRTQDRLLAVTKQALYDTISESQEPRAKGGRMPVVTGFLRLTGIAKLNGIPSGPSRGEKNKTYSWDENTILATISRLKIGDVFYFGWSAIYARKQNARHGFLDAALMNWQKHVNSAIAKFRRKDRA